MNPYNIKLTKPKIDCKFCELHNFLDRNNQPTSDQYAMCNNQNITKGVETIQIGCSTSAIMWTVACKGCKHYIYKNQLDLF